MLQQTSISFNSHGVVWIWRLIQRITHSTTPLPISFRAEHAKCGRTQLWGQLHISS
jgi:hypothetical protein